VLPLTRLEQGVPFLVSAPQKFTGSSDSIFGLLGGVNSLFPVVDEKSRCSGCPLKAGPAGGKAAATFGGILAIDAGCSYSFFGCLDACRSDSDDPLLR